MESNLPGNRTWGAPPYRVAVVHGGPGAAGEMAPVALALSARQGIFEPMQTEQSVDGQVEELRAALERSCQPPVVLVGFSWGAWLSFMLAARHPGLVSKLILIGSGPFEAKYAWNVTRTRLSRLGEAEKNEFIELLEALDTPPDDTDEDKDAMMARLGELSAAADSFDPLERGEEVVECRWDIFARVWKEAAEMRASGRLLKQGKSITCPVVAIHGDYDSHPAEGVRDPLTRVLKDFRFILLEDCGHEPWHEKAARDGFFEILRNELG